MLQDRELEARFGGAPPPAGRGGFSRGGFGGPRGGYGGRGGFYGGGGYGAPPPPPSSAPGTQLYVGNVRHGWNVRLGSYLLMIRSSPS